MTTPELEMWKLPTRHQFLIENELREGEDILWLGHPIPSEFAKRSIPVCLSGISLLSFTVTWFVTSFQFNIQAPNLKIDLTRDWFLLCLGSFFCLSGVMMMVSPWLFYCKGRKSVYLMTSERLLMIESGGDLYNNSEGEIPFNFSALFSFFTIRLHVYEAGTIRNVHRLQRTDKTGDLLFDVVVPREVNRKKEKKGMKKTSEIGLYTIPDVKLVEETLRTILRNVHPTGLHSDKSEMRR